MLSGITVAKIGGNEIDDARWLDRLARAVAMRATPLILVHGGGREVSELQRTLGAEPEWRDGLRVTTPEALRAVSMVLSGLVNKRLAALLLGAGVEAVGISGEDGALLVAEPARGGELGLTGEIRTVKPQLLLSLLESGYVPVVSPVSRGPQGGPLNVNADDAAAAVAAGVAAARFLLVSNIPGVLDGEAVLAQVGADAVEELIASGIASGGMAPKLRAAARAAAAGVADVRIGGLELLTGEGAGTRVTA
jgi:acetylglutamate kinase